MYNYHYIMLRMRNKTSKIQFYHITDKVCVCVCVCVWMLGGVWLLHLNRLDLTMNRKTESKIKQLSA